MCCWGLCELIGEHRGEIFGYFYLTSVTCQVLNNAPSMRLALGKEQRVVCDRQQTYVAGDGEGLGWDLEVLIWLYGIRGCWDVLIVWERQGSNTLEFLLVMGVN